MQGREGVERARKPTKNNKKQRRRKMKISLYGGGEKERKNLRKRIGRVEI
jgi:hypothetical protein